MLYISQNSLRNGAMMDCRIFGTFRFQVMLVTFMIGIFLEFKMSYCFGKKTIESDMLG